MLDRCLWGAKCPKVALDSGVPSCVRRAERSPNAEQSHVQASLDCAIACRATGSHIVSLVFLMMWQGCGGQISHTFWLVCPVCRRLLATASNWLPPAYISEVVHRDSCPISSVCEETAEFVDLDKLSRQDTSPEPKSSSAELL